MDIAKPCRKQLRRLVIYTTYTLLYFPEAPKVEQLWFLPEVHMPIQAQTPPHRILTQEWCTCSVSILAALFVGQNKTQGNPPLGCMEDLQKVAGDDL